MLLARGIEKKLFWQEFSTLLWHTLSTFDRIFFIIGKHVLGYIDKVIVCLIVSEFFK